MKRALICGISGQDGAYLAKLLVDHGYQVFGTSRDADRTSFANLDAVGVRDRVGLSSMSLLDFRSVQQTLRVTRPDEVYNLAGQSSVGLSFEQPVETLESISVGTLNLLESIRLIERPVRFYSAGSGECFGDTAGVGADEDTPFRPRSPYAVAKAAAYWQVSNYREAYGLHACTGILFNHESPLRPVHFVTRKIVKAACRIARGDASPLVLGNIGVRRDWGWAPEYVEAMWRMLQQPVAEDFVIATGENDSLADFVAHAFSHLGLDWERHVTIDGSLYRPADIPSNRGNASKATAKLGWRPRTTMRAVIERMVAAELAG